MSKTARLPALILWLILLVSCSQPIPSSPITKLVPQPSPSLDAAPAAPERQSPQITPVPSSTKPPVAAPTSLATLFPTSIPSPTDDPYRSISIAALAARPYGGGDLRIEETHEKNEQFTRYLIGYPSDDLYIAGFMTVPNAGTKFPVAIVLHGYLPPHEYETVTYTRRYTDALAEAGYFVIHPNLRGYPPSDSGPDLFRTGMAIDVLNLIAIIQDQSQDPLGPLRRADANDINLWGHSMGGGVALRVVTINNDPALKSAVLYGAMSGDEALNYRRIQELSGGGRGRPELDLPDESLDATSPIKHLSRVQAAISIHHSDADEVVPLAWSEDLCRQLQDLGRPAECHTYHGAPHTFNGVWDEVFTERFIRFFDTH